MASKLRTIRVIRKHQTPTSILHSIFRGQIDTSFVSTEFGKEMTDKLPIDEKNQLINRAFQILLTYVTSTEIKHLNKSSIVSTDETSLGLININSNISSDGFLYFRRFTPETNNCLYNILGCVYNDLFDNSKLEEPLYVDKYKELEEFISKDTTLKPLKDNILHILSKHINISNIIDLLEYLKIVSSWLGKQIIIVQKNLNINKELLYDSDLHLLNDNDIIFIYVYNIAKTLYFEPIINIHLLSKKLTYYIENTSITQPNIQNIIQILTTLNKQTTKKKIATKLDQAVLISDKVEFNPYDKDQLLPIIELTIEQSKYEFLLGHKIKNYHVIYDSTDTPNIAGKLVFDNSVDNGATVYFCKDYPK